jgi:hypothetical protein
MYRVLDERQFALQDQGEDTYERSAKIKVRKMITDAELEELWHRVHRVSARSARESTLLHGHENTWQSKR